MGDQTDQELLAKSSIFGDLDANELTRVAVICSRESLKFGEYIFREGDDGDQLYIVAKGAVRLSRQVPGTGEEAISVLKEGACFGEMTVLDPSPRSADAIVDSSCELLTITREDFEQLLTSHPALGTKVLRAVVRLLSERLRSTNDHLRSVYVMSMF